MPSSPTVIHTPLHAHHIDTYTPTRAEGQTDRPPAVETQPARWPPALPPPRLWGLLRSTGGVIARGSGSLLWPGYWGAGGRKDLEYGPPACVCQPVPSGLRGPMRFLADRAG